MPDSRTSVTSLKSNIYNLSFGKSYTVIQVLEKIQNLAQNRLSSTSKIIKIDFPSNKYAIEKRNARVNSNKFREESSWKPLLDIENGLNLSFDKYLAEQDNG